MLGCWNTRRFTQRGGEGGIARALASDLIPGRAEGFLSVKPGPAFALGWRPVRRSACESLKTLARSR